jgi:hypothetical protein
LRFVALSISRIQLHVEVFPMITRTPGRTISRRAAVAGAGGLGPALAAARPATAQDAMAGHPIVGTWYSLTPLGPALSNYGADGTMTVVFASTQAGQAGVTAHSSFLGAWEPTDDRGVRFTMIQITSDAAGIYLGTVTIEGFPTVAADGQTFIDAAPESKITIRDAANAVVAVIGGDGSTPPVTSVRVTAGGFTFPEIAPPAATPAA